MRQRILLSDLNFLFVTGITSPGFSCCITMGLFVFPVHMLISNHIVILFYPDQQKAKLYYSQQHHESVDIHEGCICLSIVDTQAESKYYSSGVQLT